MISGSFAIAHGPALAAVIEAVRPGVRVVCAPGPGTGGVGPESAYGTLLARAKGARSGALLVAHIGDVATHHPAVRALLRDLAVALDLDQGAVPCVRLDGDPHECFAAAIQAGLRGSYHDITQAAERESAGWGTVARIQVAPHAADTPNMLRRVAVEAMAALKTPTAIAVNPQPF